MSNENMKKPLADRAMEFSVQFPFMDGREKGDIKELVGRVSTIADFGFLRGDDNHDYAVFIVKERSKTFYFGGTVLTDQLQQLKAEGYYDDILAEGLPMLLTEKKSKNNRSYINVVFYPE